jgi:predicted dinucleotide-binding enzyme
VLFVAGDGEEAKAVVSRLIEVIGFDSLDGFAYLHGLATAEQAREALAGV